MSYIDGRSLLATFDGEVARRDTLVRTIEEDIAAHERRIAMANAEREAAYTELADLYSADDGKLGAGFGEVSRRLQKIFNEKMERRAAINALIDQLANLIAQLQAQVPDALANEHAAQMRLEEAHRAVKAELAGDAAFLALQREAEEARRAAEEAAGAQRRLRAECDAKLAAYTGHRLFRYLLHAKFGTPAYARRGWVAAGDRWVAERVAWHRNYPSFALLSELPGFAEKRAQAAQKKADLAAAAVALHVQSREAALGVGPAQNALASAAQVLTQVHEQTAKLEAQRAALMEERRSMDTGGDPFRQRAKAEMKAFLVAHPTSELKAKALATAHPRDNELVEQIERAENVINDGRKQVKSLVAERADAAAELTRAVAARRRFSSDYAGSYDRYDSGIDMTSLLLGYIAGSTSERVLWSNVDRHHHDTTPTYSYGSSDSSDSSSVDFGGDSSGGFSSGGGDAGGGSSTGGGD